MKPSIACFNCESTSSATIVTMIWAFSYGHRVRLRASAQLNQVPGPKSS